MRILTVWALVGFLSVVYANTTVTHFPTKVEAEVLKEAETDGFIIQQTHPLSGESTKPNTTLKPSFHKEENATTQGDEIEGSAAGGESFVPHGGENQTMTIKVVSSTTSSSPTGLTLDAPTATTPQAELSNTSSIKPSQSFSGYISEGFYSGSGDDEMMDQNPHSVTPGGPVNSTESHDTISTTQYDQSGSGPGPEPDRVRSFVNLAHGVHVQQTEPAPRKGHVTPDWIIILGFIVGVAALVMLCVAIATRDKWNGPSQVRHPETKTVSTNQQREQEMTTFLLQKGPKVNGKAKEYTVIPLEDLPETS